MMPLPIANNCLLTRKARWNVQKVHVKDAKGKVTKVERRFETPPPRRP